LKRDDRIRINERIRARELRVVDAEGGMLGVLTLDEALRKAREAGLDLIEISPNAVPPVAKIMDYGKYLYNEKKKAKEIKAKAHTVEVKTIQVKVGTGENDLALKARKVTEWLTEGNRVKIDLFLPGRLKYMNEKFLKERIERVLSLVTVGYKIADSAKKSPKGMSIVIERDKSAPNPKPEAPKA